jgi:ubiquitin-protein ligase
MNNDSKNTNEQNDNTNKTEKKDKQKNKMSKNNMNRLVKDVADIYKNPLNSQGIYYLHDDENMLKGYAMIIGPSDTPYEHGAYFFEFKFPTSYPFEPPSLTYITNDGITRFNPNLYRNGKVCLSIINTWHGESWTSCQTIRSVLLSLVLVFNEMPLLNEPGVLKSNPNIDVYNNCIQYKNYEIAILRHMLFETIPNGFNSFYNIYKGYLIENKDKIIDKLDKLTLKYPSIYSFYLDFYKMKTVIDYTTINEKIKINYSLLQ